MFSKFDVPPAVLRPFLHKHYLRFSADLPASGNCY